MHRCVHTWLDNNYETDCSRSKLTYILWICGIGFDSTLVSSKGRLLRWEFIKRKQESKKTRKQELDQESDQENKKENKNSNKKKKKKFLVEFLFPCFLLSIPSSGLYDAFLSVSMLIVRRDRQLRQQKDYSHQQTLHSSKKKIPF